MAGKKKRRKLRFGCEFFLGIEIGRERERERERERDKGREVEGEKKGKKFTFINKALLAHSEKKKR